VNLLFLSTFVNLQGEETQSDLDFLHLPGTSGIDELPNIVSVCAIAELLNVLHFDSYSPMQMSPEDQLMAIHVRRQTRAILQWLVRTRTLEDEQNRWMDVDIVSGTCVYWAKGLLDGKIDSEKSGIRPRVPGFTVDALRCRLGGSLGDDLESNITTAFRSFFFIRTMRAVSGQKKLLPLVSKFMFCFISS
jgi:hypothetical protein